MLFRSGNTPGTSPNARKPASRALTAVHKTTRRSDVPTSDSEAEDPSDGEFVENEITAAIAQAEEQQKRFQGDRDLHAFAALAPSVRESAPVEQVPLEGAPEMTACPARPLSDSSVPVRVRVPTAVSRGQAASQVPQGTGKSTPPRTVKKCTNKNPCPAEMPSEVPNVTRSVYLPPLVNISSSVGTFFLTLVHLILQFPVQTRNFAVNHVFK